MSRADTSDPALKKAIDNLLTNGSDNHWIMFGYEKGGSKIKVVSTGEDGLDELKDELNEGKILYALLRYDIIKMAKYVFITWCGSGVQGTVKGHFGNHCKDMEQFMKGYFHVQINARDEDDLVEKQLKEKLTKAVGANYDSGQKIQGNKRGGVSSVSEGRQAVTRALPTVSRPDRSVDSDSSKKFWDDHRRKEEEERNQKQQETLRQQTARAQINPEQREKFWQQQKQEQTQAPQTQQKSADVQQQSQEYWKAQREGDAAEKAQREKASAGVQVKADAGGLKNKFESLAKPQEAPQVQKTGAKWSKPTAEPTSAAPEPAAKPKPKPKPAAPAPAAAPVSAPPSTPPPSFKPPPPSTPPPSVKPPEPAAPPPVAAKPPPPEPAAPSLPSKPAAPPPVVNLPPKPAAPPPSVPPKPAAPPPKPQHVPEPEPEPEPAPEPEPEPQASGYAQSGYAQGGYAQSGYAQSGYAQQGAGYAQAGYAQAGYAQGGYAQAGYAQAGYAQAGYTGKLVCRALYDFNGEQEGDLSFAEGDVITVLDQSDPGGWWQGELNGVVGVFPMNFVELSPN